MLQNIVITILNLGNIKRQIVFDFFAASQLENFFVPFFFFVCLFFATAFRWLLLTQLADVCNFRHLLFSSLWMVTCDIIVVFALIWENLKIYVCASKIFYNWNGFLHVFYNLNSFLHSHFLPFWVVYVIDFSALAVLTKSFLLFIFSPRCSRGFRRNKFFHRFPWASS